MFIAGITAGEAVESLRAAQEQFAATPDAGFVAG